LKQQRQQRRQAATPILLRPLGWRRQQADFPQPGPLVDSPSVREEWRRAYKDFRHHATVDALVEEL